MRRASQGQTLYREFFAMAGAAEMGGRVPDFVPTQSGLLHYPESRSRRESFKKNH
jgi:hypothetical protein